MEEDILQNDGIIQTNENDEVLKYKELYLRTLADYQNLKKEMSDRRGEDLKRAESEILESFIPIFVNFEKANQFKPVEESKSWSAWATGIDFIQKQFQKALGEFGIEKMEVLGKKFDHNYHEVVEEVEGEEGVILKEIDAGFLQHGKVLKVAKVVVGKNKN
jgi:molecular chaperone GrpE